MIAVDREREDVGFLRSDGDRGEDRGDADRALDLLIEAGLPLSHDHEPLLQGPDMGGVVPRDAVADSGGTVPPRDTAEDVVVPVAHVETPHLEAELVAELPDEEFEDRLEHLRVVLNPLDVRERGLELAVNAPEACGLRSARRGIIPESGIW